MVAEGEQRREHSDRRVLFDLYYYLLTLTQFKLTASEISSQQALISSSGAADYNEDSDR